MSNPSPLSKNLSGEEKRQLLAQLLEKKARESKNIYPLSYAQQAMWFLYQLAPDSYSYNTGIAARILNEVDLILFKETFQDLINRHPCLRTTFREDSGKMIQEIHSHHELYFEEINASSWDETRLFDEVMQALRKPFDLEHGPVLRVSLFTVSPTEHVFLVAVHHIVIDGRSVRVLLNEFLTLYNTKKSGTASSLPPLQEQFASYVQWEEELVNNPVGDRHWSYWREKLAGELPALDLPTDRTRPAIQTYHGATHHFTIDKKLTQQIRTVAQESGATLYMFLLAAFQVLLNRYTHQEDFLVGSAVTGTNQVGFADIIGYMVNVVALRANISDELTFKELLFQTRQAVLEMLEHRDFPFPLLVERLKPERDPSRTPLYQVLFDLQKIQKSEPLAALLNPEKEKNRVDLGNLTLEPFWTPVQEGLVDLSLQVVETEDVLWATIKYNTDLFDASTVARMSSHFLILLNGIVTNPDSQISTLPLLTNTEQQLLLEWNDTEADYPQNICIHQLIEAQAKRTPEMIAVSFEGQQLTYHELNAKANQLAHHLQTLGVGPEILVGLCADRSLEMVVGLLGILKAGGAYVPLDPTYPQERLSFMLADALVPILLTQKHLEGIIPNHNAQVVYLDTDWVTISRKSQDNPETSITIDNLAYVIYTSGSTGKPKGVLLTHRGLTNVSEAQVRAFGLESHDHVLQFSSLNFDASTFEIFMALRVGATLYLGSKESLQPGTPLAQFIKDSAISIVTLPPSVLALLPDENFPSLRTINVAGEACSSELVNRWAGNRRFFNLYGPTESTIWATMWECTSSEQKPPIGRPISNIQIHILDTHLQPVPIGVPGELHIGGVGLARGYLNRPELTAEKFILNPLSPKNGDLLYKTGDLARYLPNGDIEFLGRIDHQVKVRGFRIELGEIESLLKEHPAVLDATVIIREREIIGKQIVAYIVLQRALDATKDDIQKFLKDRLPEYMVPSAFEFLDKLPLTPNGKVDRKALPEPDIANQQAIYIAPRNEAEKILCEIWQEILGIERIGISDNFFHLGGHSLLATRLAAQINQKFNVTLPLKTIFAEQTVQLLAQAVTRLNIGTDRPALVRTSRDGTLLLSYAQQRLWLLDQIDGGSAHYNIAGALKLSGELHYPALNQAFTTILQRHESLRTCFAVGNDGQPYQVIQHPPQFVAAIQDLSHLPEESRQPTIAELVDQEASRLFDLTTDLMLRAKLIKVAADEHILLVTMHHIASDGWSIAIFIDEFSTLYSAFRQNRENPLPPLNVQYADYARWQRNWLQGDVLDQQLGYWEQQLAALPITHSLPLDHPRPTVQRFAGSIHRSQIEAGISRALHTLCQAHGATLFMGLHAAFSALLARYSNELDIVVGSPIANREQAEVSGLIGFFVNTLVLRSDLSNNPSFIELLDQSKHMLLDAYAHQQVPFELIVERLQPDRSLSHNALFQIMLVLQNNQQGTLALPGLTLHPLEKDGEVHAKFDLTLNVIENPDGMQLDWEYNTDLFDANTIERMAVHFNLLLTSLLDAPNKNVFNTNLLSETERQQMLVAWNNTTAEYPKEKCIHQLFEEQVAIHPDLIAAVYEDHQLSYSELNKKANQLAHYLISEKQVKPDTLVGICMERSLEMVVAILGVLKAGGAYVPLDPDYPKARLAYMLADADLATVLTQSRMLERSLIAPAQAICLDDVNIQHQLASLSTANPDAQHMGLTSRHLAYVIYTSGSTGNPKGVQAPHASILNRVNWLENQYPALVDDVFCQKTASGFVDHVAEIFQALGYGCRLIVVSTQDTLDPDKFKRIIAQHKVTRLTLVPSLLKYLIEQRILATMTSLRLVISSGETLQMEETRGFYHALPKAKLLNLYGSSEVGADVSAYWIEQLNGLNKIPIGRPIDNIQLYVVNSQLQLVPQGTPGELLIGGIGLARGYLNRPELTAEKFILNPFYDSNGPNSSEHLYKTGDLVRWLPDGNLEFLGRIDHQVKIRGFRIELGEVENALSAHDRVKDAVVLAKESANGDRQLIAYIVTDQTHSSLEDSHGVIDNAIPMGATFIEQVRQHLRQSLPEYMVPSAFVILDKLPLTPNGKVDRKALPEPDLANQQAVYMPPRNETEKVLCEIWQEILGIERVGISDNFFHLGGHSLLATQVNSRIRQSFNVELPLRTLFEAPTVEGLVLSILRKKAEQIGNDKLSELLASLENMSAEETEAMLKDNE